MSGIALSRTGDRLALASNPSAGEGHIVYYEGQRRVFDATGVDVPGRVNAIDLTEDGRFLVAGGLVHQAEGGYGAVYHFTLPEARPWRHTILQTGSVAEVVSVDASRDGRVFAALTSGGDILVFEKPPSGDPQLVATLSAGSAQGKRVALSADGNVLASAAGAHVTVYHKSGSAYAKSWNQTLPASVTALDLDETGGVVLVATGGASGATQAFGTRRATELWRVPGGTEHAALAANGTSAVLAQGRAISAYALPTRFTLAPADPAAPAPALAPFATGRATLVLTNDGASPVSADLVLPRSRDVSFGISPSRLDVLPGERAFVNVTFTPGRLPPGLYTYTIHAKNAAGGETTNATVSFTLTPQSSLDVQLSGALERRIGQRANDSILFTLTNDGNTAQEVTVGILQSPTRGGNWNVRLSGEPTFQLAAGARSTARVLVETTDRVENGTTNRLTLTFRSASFSKTHEVVYTVNPTVGVNVTSMGRAKVLAPGDHSQFNLTVTNTGTISAFFMAIYEPRPSSERPWVVDLDPSPFLLAPGDQNVVPVRVFAPRSGELGDRVAIDVEIQSVPQRPGDEIARAEITLTANVQPRVVATTPTETRPAPGSAGALALIALAGAAAFAALAGDRRGRAP